MRPIRNHIFLFLCCFTRFFGGKSVQVKVVVVVVVVVVAVVVVVVVV